MEMNANTYYKKLIFFMLINLVIFLSGILISRAVINETHTWVSEVHVTSLFYT
jgi:hypothetical protein